MSLIRCPECGKEMSDKAETCPNCGYAERSIFGGSQKQKPKLGCLGVIALIFFAIVIFNHFGSSSSETKSAEEMKRDIEFEREYQANDAYYTATNFVKRRLKSPSEAEFPKPKYARIQLLEDGATYKIYGYVDSQNSYGATLRVNWYVKLILNGNEWQLLDMEIYER